MNPRLHFQLVPEPKQAKNRVHLDFRCGDLAGRDSVAAKAVKLGARVLYEASQGPNAWVTLADPEGNELCIGA